MFVGSDWMVSVVSAAFGIAGSFLAVIFPELATSFISKPHHHSSVVPAISKNHLLQTPTTTSPSTTPAFNIMASRLAVRRLPTRCLCSTPAVARSSTRAFSNVCIRSPSNTLLSAVSRSVPLPISRYISASADMGTENPRASSMLPPY
ncbi:hypothetical protein K440DRAFT_292134 [Wilcoxina mikolae CBS 423.85]|nr:hypothetical protein K440DRAFT_292134 [Wilcoxina mikolae CBS 423.85]